jgi:hypothetical protein
MNDGLALTLNELRGELHLTDWTAACPGQAPGAQQHRRQLRPGGC